ncbi:hypothetical protein [Mannheimia pernigra]|uniref:hypothetical protein n=1 Tax=Mannheimia pernigra TaxID=111844 RepID=UPI00159F3E29|nr:hypothetical protein [Mannheimia pernigra]QLB43576.1 hypothetical protein HV561_01700 [Mannheimia pernigra]
MQEKIDGFTQANAEFSAGYQHLASLKEELNRQEKILIGLDNEISNLQAVQSKSENSEDVPNAGVFLKHYQKEQELIAKRSGIRQFIQQISHNIDVLTLDLAEKKRGLINLHSELMEGLGGAMIEELAAQIAPALRNAILTIQTSANFAEFLRNRENILRKNIDPFDYLMNVFIETLTEKARSDAGEAPDDEALKYQLNHNELDEIPDISPIKLQQKRQALTQSTY